MSYRDVIDNNIHLLSTEKIRSSDASQEVDEQNYTSDLERNDDDFNHGHDETVSTLEEDYENTINKLGLHMYSNHDDHIHISHICAYSGGSCRLGALSSFEEHFGQGTDKVDFVGLLEGSSWDHEITETYCDTHLRYHN
ncbi:hypothetical protein QTP88_004894 [Uroleucon formosanum]